MTRRVICKHCAKPTHPAEMIGTLCAFCVEDQRVKRLG